MLTALALLTVPFPVLPQEPRVALETGPVRVLSLPAIHEDATRRRLIVKFADATRTRARVGGLISLSAADLAPVTAMAALEGLTFAPLVRLTDAKLAALEARAAARSGRNQPDLAGMVVVEVAGADAARLAAIGNALQALPQVEFAHLQLLDVPPPGDLAPPTPQYKGLQDYRKDDPGMSVDYAWWWNARGNGIRLSDCEYGWNPDHEGLNSIDLHLEPGQTIHEDTFFNGWDRHGTAVLGQTSAPDYGYGVAGMVPGAVVYTYPEKSEEEGSRRVTAITNAIADSALGDVVLLEMQTTGPGGGYAPAEVNPAVWAVVKVGTDAGVIVVGAAGNGAQDLDSAPYDDYASWGDSGAILVGAGSPDVQHDKLGFSTFGNRVNMQGWGGSVFTLDYGDYAELGGDPNQSYTSNFTGTSSASPFVASACVAINSHMKYYGQALFDPAQMRNHLVNSGLPQGSGGHIGPFPDLRTAIDILDLGDCPSPWLSCDGDPNSAGAGASLNTLGSTSLSANDLTLMARKAPVGQFGLFFYGPGDARKAVSAGTLCVGGGIVRIPTVLQIDGSGMAVLDLDLTQAPFVGGPGELTPGSTWYFQFWFRDKDSTGAPASNFSDSLALPFCD